MSRLKALMSFFDEREIDFMIKISREIESSKLDLPVFYAGSGGDVEHALILGDRLVFVDSHLPEVTLSEIRRKIIRIGGKILEEKKFGRLGKGGKHVLRFEFQGEVELTYYAEDVMRILERPPNELKEGCSVYFVKVPHPKEPNVKSLNSPELLSKALKLIVVGGYYLERECPICRVLDPNVLGFKRVASGYISALSIHKAEGNLYKKFKDVEDIEDLLRLDLSLCKLL